MLTFFQLHRCNVADLRYSQSTCKIIKNISINKSIQSKIGLISTTKALINFDQLQIGYNVQPLGSFIVADLESANKTYADKFSVTEKESS